MAEKLFYFRDKYNSAHAHGMTVDRLDLSIESVDVEDYQDVLRVESHPEFFGWLPVCQNTVSHMFRNIWTMRVAVTRDEMVQDLMAVHGLTREEADYQLNKNRIAERDRHGGGTDEPG